MGPNSFAITPIKAVVSPPVKYLIANSYYFVLLSVERLMLIVKSYLRQAAHKESDTPNNNKMKRLAVIATRILYRISA